MARNKIGLQVKGLDEYMAKLDELGDSKAMTQLPAGGRYSTGNTKESIDESMTVDWEGMTASIKVGFDFKKSGMTSIFLMYGTPKHDPVAGLYAAIYGAKTQREIGAIQAEALQKVIEEFMEGD